MRFTQTQLTKLQQQYIKVHLEDPALLRALYGFAAVSLEGSLPLPVRLSLSLSLSLSRSLMCVICLLKNAEAFTVSHRAIVLGNGEQVYAANFKTRTQDASYRSSFVKITFVDQGAQRSLSRFASVLAIHSADPSTTQAVATAATTTSSTVFSMSVPLPLEQSDELLQAYNALHDSSSASSASSSSSSSSLCSNEFFSEEPSAKRRRIGPPPLRPPRPSTIELRLQLRVFHPTRYEQHFNLQNYDDRWISYRDIVSIRQVALDPPSTSGDVIPYVPYDKYVSDACRLLLFLILLRQRCAQVLTRGLDISVVLPRRNVSAAPSL